MSCNDFDPSDNLGGTDNDLDADSDLEKKKWIFCVTGIDIECNSYK